MKSVSFSLPELVNASTEKLRPVHRPRREKQVRLAVTLRAPATSLLPKSNSSPRSAAAPREPDLERRVPESGDEAVRQVDVFVRGRARERQVAAVVERGP